MNDSPLHAVIILGFCCSSAASQSLDARCLDLLGFDDGVAETSWKLQNPSGPQDWVSIDFDTEARGRKILGVAALTAETGANAAIAEIGIYPDNLTLDPTGKTPDISAPLTSIQNPVPISGEFCAEFAAYDTPDVQLGSTAVHAAFQFAPDDRDLWLCSDDNLPDSGRSYFSIDGYATPALPISADLMLRLAAAFDPGSFTINGSTSTSLRIRESICMTFWGTATIEPYLQFLNEGGALIGPLPAHLILTGVPPWDGAGPAAGTLRATAFCEAKGTVSHWLALYADLTDLNPRGKPRIKASTEATLTIEDSEEDCGCCRFGRRDGGYGETLWKVQNPAGSRDWFSVSMGRPEEFASPSCRVSTITGVSIVAADFCGTGPCWEEVGIYDANTSLDPTGATPDVQTSLAVVRGANACLPPGAYAWSYPGTFFDTPDIGADSAQAYHAAVNWPTDDSCIWLKSDDGHAHDCHPPQFGNSFFSVDDYLTAAIPFAGANWMIKLDWQ